MNFDHKFPEEGEGEQVLVYLIELRETLTTWDRSIQAQLKRINSDINKILSIITGTTGGE